MNIQGNRSRARYAGCKDTDDVQIYGSLSAQSRRRVSGDGHLAFKMQLGSRTFQLCRLQGHDGIGVVHADRLRNSELILLIARLQDGNRKMALEPGLVLQWAF